MSSRKCLTQVIWGLVLFVIILDIILYLNRQFTYQTCDIELLGTSPNHAKIYPQPVKPNDDMKYNGSDLCQPNVPCIYPEEVDFRIIVMTHKRTDSLVKALKSLDNIELDGDKAALEIFIDRDNKGQVHTPTVEAAEKYKWALGEKRVHVWSRHVGIYGQWIDTWRPRNASREISLILEDDMSVSRYCYKWLKAAHRAYDNRTDVSGYTLQGKMKIATGNKELTAPKEHTAFLYRVLGSWGFSPHPRTWRAFQDWYYEVQNDKAFHPYVPGIVMTSWYKSFEKSGKKDTMWTMWHIWFTDKHNLFCLMNNLAKHTGLRSAYLGVNRQEPGLHFGGKGINNTSQLLNSWQDSYVSFPKEPIKLHYDGTPVNMSS